MWRQFLLDNSPQTSQLYGHSRAEMKYHCVYNIPLWYIIIVHIHCILENFNRKRVTLADLSKRDNVTRGVNETTNYSAVTLRHLPCLEILHQSRIENMTFWLPCVVSEKKRFKKETAIKVLSKPAEELQEWERQYILLCTCINASVIEARHATLKLTCLMYSSNPGLLAIVRCQRMPSKRVRGWGRDTVRGEGAFQKVSLIRSRYY